MTTLFLQKRFLYILVKIANKKEKIARGNTTALKSNLEFDPRDDLNKALVFDMKKAIHL